jgi:hypothetical protein
VSNAKENGKKYIKGGCEKKREEKDWNVETKKEPLIDLKLSISFIRPEYDTICEFLAALRSLQQVCQPHPLLTRLVESAGVVRLLNKKTFNSEERAVSVGLRNRLEKAA